MTKKSVLDEQQILKMNTTIQQDMYDDLTYRLQIRLCTLLIMTHLMLHTGIRRGEALGLKWENVDLSKREIYIKRVGKQKVFAGEYNPEILVITNTVGSMLEPRNLQRAKDCLEKNII